LIWFTATCAEIQKQALNCASWVNALVSAIQRSCRKTGHLEHQIHQIERCEIAAEDRRMTNSTETAGRAEPSCSRPMLADAIDNLSLGVVVFDGKRDVVFCNKRYTEIYGLTAEQVRPGTIAYTVYPMPGGGGMATHEDITDQQEMGARLQAQIEFGKQQEEALRIRNLQFDTAINNMSQGLCFFDADHRLIVCNDRYVEMYGLPRDRVGPGTPLSEIVDMRLEAGSFPAMSREEYLRWRDKVTISAEPSDSILELRNGRTIKIRHRPISDATSSDRVLELPRDLRQHLEQRGAPVRPEQFVEAGFVLGGDELLGPYQHRAALVGQRQDMGSSIVGGLDPRTEIAALEPVQHRDEIRPEDAERIGDFGLVAPGILLDQDEDGKLRGRQLQRRHAAQEILEHLELRALEGIAEQLGQFADLQRIGVDEAVGGVLAGRLAGFGASPRGSPGNGHRTVLGLRL
jgi:PAS domain-containing protein